MSITVRSSNVAAVDYNALTKTLTVQFKSGTYDYFDVAAEHWDELERRIADPNVGSIGGYVSGHIARQHQYRKHEEPRHG